MSHQGTAPQYKPNSIYEDGGSLSAKEHKDEKEPN